MARGDRYAPQEDEIIYTMISEGKGYKTIAAALCRTRDSVRSRWRELTGQGRETRRENRAIGGKSDGIGWYARRKP